MADSPIFYDVREDLLRMAEEYDVLARQRAALDRHKFGQPLDRAAKMAGHPALGDRQDNSDDRRRTG